MKILYHHRLASKDGQLVHVEEIQRSLRDLGHELIEVSPNIGATQDFGFDGGIVTRLKAMLPGAVYEIMEFLYGVVIVPKLLLAVLKHKPVFIYERYNLYQPYGVWLAKLLRKPIVLEVNAPLALERSTYGNLSLVRFAKAVERYTWSRADTVICVTEELRKIVSAELDGKDSHTVVMHNGASTSLMADMERAIAEREASRASDGLVVGFVGFFHEWHNLDGTLRAIANCDRQDVRFRLVGDGPAAQQLRQLAGELGIEHRVEFLGQLGREETLAQVGTFDIALQPAVTGYASPLKLFEYMAAGSVIIAPDSPNILEIVDESTALIFENGNHEAFAACLERAINDYGELEVLGANARRRIDEAEFLWLENARKSVALGSGSTAPGA